MRRGEEKGMGRAEKFQGWYQTRDKAATIAVMPVAGGARPLVSPQT